MQKKNETGKRIAFVIFVILTVVWMMVIFGFSANNADESTIQSNAVTEFIIRIFNRDFDDMSPKEQLDLINSYDKIVRKSAHFIAYAVLGFLMYFSLNLAPFRYGIGKYKSAMLSLPLCVVFAVTDEYHQTFVDGRAGRFSDVIIDSSGALCGTLFALIALSVAVKWIVNKQNRRGG